MDVPSVTMSWAQSLDGRIATLTGDSRWISGGDTLDLAHRLREENDAVLVGIGTILADDPELTCRREGARSQPLRVILDSRLRLPLDCRVAATAGVYRTLVIATHSGTRESAEKAAVLRKMGIEVEAAAEDPNGHVDPEDALRILGVRGIGGVFVEGGSAVITSFLVRRLVSRLIIVTAPILIGDGIPAVGDLGVRHLSDAFRLARRHFSFYGRDGVWDLELLPAASGTESEGKSRS